MMIVTGRVFVAECTQVLCVSGQNEYSDVCTWKNFKVKNFVP